MDKISYFKLQAKNLMRDFKTQQFDAERLTCYSPRFFEDIDDIIVSFDVDEEHFTLMNAQHIVACLAGFDKWTDLLHASDAALELGKLLFDIRNRFTGPLREDWERYLSRCGLMDASDETKLELFKEVYT